MTPDAEKARDLAEEQRADELETAVHEPRERRELHAEMRWNARAERRANRRP